MNKLNYPLLVKAAIVRQKGGPFNIETIQISEPRPLEVLVKLTASGMCHTDMVARDGVYPVPQPIVLGHEGSGIVAAVGSEVTSVVPGDHVVMTNLSCGHCPSCLKGHPAFCENGNQYNFSGARPDGSHVCSDENGKPLNDRFFGQSSFAEYAVANERNVVKVDKDVPLKLLGPLGCGIQTGAGSIINVLRPEAGSSLAVFGTGAVGLSAIMAAKAIGVTTIIAVDVVPERLQTALELGATHTINSKTEKNVPEAVRQINGGRGVDYAFDSTGRADVVRSAVDSLCQEGVCGIVGASKPGTELVLDMDELMQSCKQIRGIVEGGSVSALFIPQLISLYRQGRFPFDKLIRFYSLDEINQAAADSAHGKTVKPVIVF